MTDGKSKKELRKEKLRDLLRWGEVGLEEDYDEDILTDGDLDLIDVMEDLCHKEECAKEEAKKEMLLKKKQVKLTDLSVTVKVT